MNQCEHSMLCCCVCRTSLSGAARVYPHSLAIGPLEVEQVRERVEEVEQVLERLRTQRHIPKTRRHTVTARRPCCSDVMRHLITRLPLQRYSAAPAKLCCGLTKLESLNAAFKGLNARLKGCYDTKRYAELVVLLCLDVDLNNLLAWHCYDAGGVGLLCLLRLDKLVGAKWVAGCRLERLMVTRAACVHMEHRKVGMGRVL